MTGKFIVFEGLDGAGVTTQATLLRNYFISKGKDAVLTKEPTEGILGGIIKSALRNEWETDPLTLQMMFAADRSHHISSEIDPALKNDKVVICDRYVLSSLAFGSVYISLETLKQLNVYFRKPNLTIIVDTHPKMCIERMKKARHHVEMFEKEQKLEQIRKNYIALRNYFPETYFVDGNKSADEVMTEIRKIVESKI